jgi:hypothetical protein
MHNVKRLLVPIDFSPESERALNYVKQIGFYLEFFIGA